MKTKELSKQYKQYCINLRREFHMYPEASMQEIHTSARIKEELRKLGITYKEAAGTGIVATIEGSKPGKTVALRADMDALQVNECTNVEYQSKNSGLMHACGHDNHIAMLLTAARILNDMKEEIKGTVKLLFQPGEEVALGARKMIEAGAVAGVDSIFGIHVWADVESGKVCVEPGPAMASSDMFKVYVEGKGGHGSAPHQGIDAVVTASGIVMNLQTAVSREITPLEPVVVSVGSLHSGTRFNVIANEAVLEGTTRTFDQEIRKQLPEIMERIINNTAATFRAKVKVEYTYGTPAVINDSDCAKIAQQAAIKLAGPEVLFKLGKIMGAEDFAEYMNRVPGTIAFLGIKNEAVGAVYPQHHPKYNVDENALELGAALYAQFAVDFFNAN